MSVAVSIPRKENGTFERAIGEIKAGRKSSCWMWFVIPSPPHMKNNVEHGSSMNRKYLDPRFASFLGCVQEANGYKQMHQQNVAYSMC